MSITDEAIREAWEAFGVRIVVPKHELPIAGSAEAALMARRGAALKRIALAARFDELTELNHGRIDTFLYRRLKEAEAAYVEGR